MPYAQRGPRLLALREVGSLRRDPAVTTQCLRISMWIQFGCLRLNGLVAMSAQKAAFANTL